MSNYDIFQQVYQLSMASNLVRACQGTPQELQDKLAAALPGVLDQYAGPGWEVVWGPAVWKHEGGTDEMPPDNVWYVAKKSSATFEDGSTCTVYVVAIAATAGEKKEEYDWQCENFGVDEVVEFEKWAKDGIDKPPQVWTPAFGLPKPLTAKGTTEAVYGLLNFLPAGASETRQSLSKFLQNVDAPAGSKVIFTGQSLGGALSPTSALTLKLSGYLQKFSEALVYGSAGASPGNAKFAALFSQHFPAKGDRNTYKIWNLNLVNTLDVVPNAWCRAASSPLHLGRINTLYGELPLALALTIGTGVNFLRNKAAASTVNYMPLEHADFTGQSSLPPPTDLPSFIQNFLFHHMAAYHTYVLGSLNIPEQLCETTPEREAFLISPVIGCLDESIKGHVPKVPEVPDEDKE